MKKHFDVIKAVSPSDFGGETKNQDRIMFDSQTYTAGVCDGTTSSPYAEQAASIVARCSPLLIHNDAGKNLKTISDLLIVHRNAAIKKGIKLSENISESMRTIMEETAKEKLKRSFQTTLVCAGFERQGKSILAKILCCGDSGFFAFSPDGKLLLSNLSMKEEELADSRASQYGQINFSAGTELLTKVIGPLSKFPLLAEHAAIPSLDNWVLCRALCLCENGEPLVSAVNGTKLVLQQNELLIAPKYFFSAPKDPLYKEFRRLFYSRFIQRLSSPAKAPSEVNFDMRGSVTAVLPDHCYTGQWDYFEERFEPETHFFLCSDGFYHVFSNASEMCEWLTINKTDLTVRQKKISLLNELHRKLSDKCGDDDISFIWIYPKDNRRKADVV